MFVTLFNVKMEDFQLLFVVYEYVSSSCVIMA